MTIQYDIHYSLKKIDFPVLTESIDSLHITTHTMKIEKDKFNSLSEKDQNLQLLKVSMNVLFPFIKNTSKMKY